jgi:hypothetical protein
MKKPIIKENEVILVWDCRHKEILRIKRISGDLSLEFQDSDGRIIFTSWYQMKKPYKETFEKIINLFSGLKDLLMRQKEIENAK